jgi:Complex1_LYR-like
MRISIRALAQVSTKPINPLPPNLQVLPPLTLYRRILRAHRKYLPEEARYLGDRYVKAEFHRTKDTDNPVHIIGFLTQWQVHTILILSLLEEYCQAVEGEHWKDGKVDMSLIEKMSDEQLGQVNFGFVGVTDL